MPRHRTAGARTLTLATVLAAALLTACGTADTQAEDRPAAPSNAMSGTGGGAPATTSAASVPVSAGSRLGPTASSVTASGITPKAVPITTAPSVDAPPVTRATGRPAVAAGIAFAASVSRVTTAQLGASWHAGCPVGAAQLRQLQLTYWGFDGRPHTGVLVVNADVTAAVTSVFHRLYDARFPIRSIRPTADFGGSDPKSMAADNTSAFNCRLAVTSGPASWSVHAYGKAIDVNTVENPYLETGMAAQPSAGAAYTNRANVRPGMAVPGGTLVEAFASIGWPWGGRWSEPDFQHFSATGG